MYSTLQVNQNARLFDEIVNKLIPPDGGDHHYPDVNGNYWTACPFHKDPDFGSFKFNEKGFICNSCGKSGTLLELGLKIDISQGEVNSKEKSAGLTLAAYAV